MSSNHHIQLFLLLIIFSFLSLTLSTYAAEPETATATVRAVEAEEKVKTVKARKLKAPTLSKKLQKALESGDTRAAISECGADCKTSSTTITAAGGGGTRDYTCNSGNCACAGAADCVAMAPICQEGTIGCNDYGCTCKEG